MWWCTPIIPALERLRLEHHYVFEANLGYIARFCLKNKTKKRTDWQWADIICFCVCSQVIFTLKYKICTFLSVSFKMPHLGVIPGVCCCYRIPETVPYGHGGVLRGLAAWSLAEGTCACVRGCVYACARPRSSQHSPEMP